ncbi:DUF3592 domain-containing protein [Flammeovirgaceae bacterium SG7u.111]|nr:DUF3592 domain-containing protein [Flammeovirgaceae bacterium SG7u.132]WPO35326.1 DUF3592 domain-containing protein [Flammeovirgaceae bacterium SG7u.111]
MNEEEIIFYCITIAALGFGVYNFLRLAYVKKNWVRVDDAIVQELIKKSGGNSTSILYYPVIRFQTLKKESKTVTSSIGYFPAYLTEGDYVTIYYDPHYPMDIVIEKYKIIFGGIGIIASVFLTILFF